MRERDLRSLWTRRNNDLALCRELRARRNRTGVKQVMDDDQRFEIIVEQLPDGTYLARSFGCCIVTEADNLADLKTQVREAVCCHFDEDCAPRGLLLRFIKTVREETVD